ncbi:membrane protein of unknown function [Candidatus Methylomirabilis oxygeniifera]|uniref:Uncharacterized protein n=1 Tax=Methylomirabilis oxygeniifera TaxID=671143 RepID=D5MLD2_METO1|nr:membrane protein of unknown function [Candidatus Methylomirabilis oxyfera]
MDSRYIAAVSMAFVIAIGFLRTLTAYRGLKKRRDFVSEFSDKFVEFANNPDFDGKLYYWLTHNSVAIQSELGPLGVASYKPPAIDYVIHNYQMIVNLLPELRRKKTENRLFRDGEIHREYATMCLDILVRYLGVIDRWLQEARDELRNPFIWLGQGVQSILLLPAYVLHWFGLLGASALGTLTRNILVKSISFIVAVVGLLSSLVTLLVGWEETARIIGPLWRDAFGP